MIRPPAAAVSTRITCISIGCTTYLQYIPESLIEYYIDGDWSYTTESWFICSLTSLLSPNNDVLQITEVSVGHYDYNMQHKKVIWRIKTSSYLLSHTLSNLNTQCIYFLFIKWSRTIRSADGSNTLISLDKVDFRMFISVGSLSWRRR